MNNKYYECLGTDMLIPSLQTINCWGFLWSHLWTESELNHQAQELSTGPHYDMPITLRPAPHLPNHPLLYFTSSLHAKTAR